MWAGENHPTLTLKYCWRLCLPSERPLLVRDVCVWMYDQMHFFFPPCPLYYFLKRGHTFPKHKLWRLKVVQQPLQWLERGEVNVDLELMSPHSPRLLIRSLILFINIKNNRNQTPGNVCQGCEWNGLMRRLHMWMMKYAWVIPSFLFQIWDH